jgi:hypothetical protein
VDVPPTLLTGEITALALRVSCAFAFAVNTSATQKTLQRALCNGQRNVARMSRTLGSFAP